MVRESHWAGCTVEGIGGIDYGVSRQKKSKKECAGGGSSEHDPTSPDSPSSHLPELRECVEDAGTDLDQMIIVRPSSEDNASYFQKLFDAAGRDIPEVLVEWESRVDGWCDDYRVEWGMASILQIDMRVAVYVFDQSLERVLLAYGLSSPQIKARDKNRMRHSPDVNIGARMVMGGDTVEYDRGHFLGHAAGGELDINLFPQRRRLNRGCSEEGKRFTRMERHAATHVGTFVYHRAIYSDDTWIPDRLEYGLLVDDNVWWVETFSNRNADA